MIGDKIFNRPPLLFSWLHNMQFDKVIFNENNLTLLGLPSKQKFEVVESLRK